MPIVDTCGIIVAAGESSRMNGISKQLAMLNGKPVFAYAIECMEKCPSIGEIVIVIREDESETVSKYISRFNSVPVRIVTGGATRQQSVAAGIKVSNFPYVAVHDGARPLISPEDVERVIKDARVFGAATLGVPIKDTVKLVEDMLITDTPPRHMLYAVQTPQVFKKDIWERGFLFAVSNDLEFTDDCQLVEAVGGKVAVTSGSYSNIKITTPEDMIIAGTLLSMRYDNSVNENLKKNDTLRVPLKRIRKIRR